MSSEVEAGKEQEAKPLPKEPLKKRLVEQWPIVFKIFELVISITCLGFAFDPLQKIGLGKSQLHHVGITYTAFTGYMLIILVLLLSRAIGERLPFRTSTIFSIAGAILYLVTGTVLTVDRANLANKEVFHPHLYLLHMLTTSILFSFANACVFLADGVLTYMKQRDF